MVWYFGTQVDFYGNYLTVILSIVAFLNIPPAQFKLILDSIIWGFKHSMRNVAEIGLEILQRLLQNVACRTPDEAAQSFYQTFFTDLLEHVLSVATDSSQAQVAGNVLRLMLKLFKELITPGCDLQA